MRTGLRSAARAVAVSVLLAFGCTSNDEGSRRGSRADDSSGGSSASGSVNDPSVSSQSGSGGAASASMGSAEVPSTTPATSGSSSPMHAGAPTSSDFTSGLTPPDPNVSFEWTASLPGEGECLPGRYTGTFTCEYYFMESDPAPLAIVTGPVAITLEESQDGEFLEITDGSLEGIAQLIFGFRAQLEGRLECATRRLEATAVNGQYGFGDPAVLPLGTFEGALGGLLDPLAGMLDGDWDLSVTAGAAGGFCRGPWQANWAP